MHAAEVASWLQERPRVYKLASDCTLNLSTRLLSNSSRAVRSPQACSRSLNLSRLWFWRLAIVFSLLLALSFLSCLCCCFPCLAGSLSRSSPRHARCSFLSFSPSCWSHYVEHVQQNRTAQPRVSFTAHAHYVPPTAWTGGHMDKQTHGQMNFCWMGSLTLAPNTMNSIIQYSLLWETYQNILSNFAKQLIITSTNSDYSMVCISDVAVEVHFITSHMLKSFFFFFTQKSIMVGFRLILPLLVPHK